MEETKYEQVGISDSVDFKTRKKGISSFLFRVYSLLASELLYTLSIVGFITFKDNFREFVNHTQWLTILCAFASIASLLVLFFVKRKYPWNVIFLATVVTLDSYLVTAICCQLHEFGMEEVIYLTFMTALLIFVTLSVFSIQTRYDFTMLRGILLACVSGVLFWGLLSLVIGFQLYFLSSLAGAIVFSLCMVCDVSLMLQNYPLVDPLDCSIEVYLEPINLFLNIARFLIKLKNKK